MGEMFIRLISLTLLQIFCEMFLDFQCTCLVRDLRQFSCAQKYSFSVCVITDVSLNSDELRKTRNYQHTKLGEYSTDI